MTSDELRPETNVLLGGNTCCHLGGSFMDSFSRSLPRVCPVPAEPTSGMRTDQAEPRCSRSAEGDVSTITHTRGAVHYSTAVYTAPFNSLLYFLDGFTFILFKI